jgi:hypothetical protein
MRARCHGAFFPLRAYLQRPAPQDSPALKHEQRLIEVPGHGRNGAGSFQLGKRLRLCRRRMSARDLKFEPVQPTLMEHEHVRHARSDAQALQDRGLGRVTVAAIWQ